MYTIDELDIYACQWIHNNQGNKHIHHLQKFPCAHLFGVVRPFNMISTLLTKC